MIRKFQLGGSQQGGILAQIQLMPKELQQELLQAFALWAQQKGLDINALQSNPQALEQALGLFIQEVQALKTRAARHGAKLNYIKSLKHKCADDEEPYYLRKGGNIVDCGCKKKEDGGELEEGKKGMKVEKDCGGSTIMAKFRAKCGAKMKKHRLGGSLNGIPFMLQGTNKGGIKKSKAENFYYPTKLDLLRKGINHVISKGFNIPEGRTEPGKFEYFLVDGLKLPPKIIKPIFDGIYNTNNYIKELLSQPVIRESPYEKLLRITKPTKKITPIK